MFVFGLCLLVIAIVVLKVLGIFLADVKFGKLISRSLCGLLLLCSGLTIVFSTAIDVGDDEGGLVIVKWLAPKMPADRLIASNGEMGPQAAILPPGRHFWYWPWKYELHAVKSIFIPTGSVGTVIAHDGKPLPPGEVYAHEWSSPQEMLDGEKFMKEGYKGAQLTVIPPGQYRYNPRLFEIAIEPAVTVKVGEVIVVKANAGPEYKGEDVELANGVPIVPNGFRGIWKKALVPNQYYMHPEAYELVPVQTTNRVYSYTNATTEAHSKADRPGDNHSINVRTKDGFEFPIDVRAALKISADDAPYVVARIGPPDSDENNDGFNKLEDTIVLPTVRAVFRNGSEVHGALEYVNMRSTIEKQATQLVAEELKQYRVDVDGIYIADIGLSITPQGQELLKTQTDKEVAKQEQATWLEKKLAAEARAQSVRADTEATQEAKQVEAEVAIKVAHSRAEAAVAEAEGEAKAARMKIEALGGQHNYMLLKAVEVLSERLVPGVLPQVVVTGDGKLDSAVLGKLIQQTVDKSPVPKVE